MVTPDCGVALAKPPGRGAASEVGLFERQQNVRDPLALWCPHRIGEIELDRGSLIEVAIQLGAGSSFRWLFVVAMLTKYLAAGAGARSLR